VSGEPPDSESPPISAYLSEPLANGLRRERIPDVALPPRRHSADATPAQLWPWRPTRELGAVLADVLVFLQAEDELLGAATQVAEEVRAA
jgi:hypothetical protein